jgi:tRNA-specific 2-thiouridylase
VGVDGAGVPLHVLRVDPERDEVVVGPREALATDRVRVGGVRLHRDAGAVAQVKLRYRSAPVPCRLSAGDGVVELLEPVDGAAPGQTAVFLGADDAVVGSATIRR